MLRMYESDRALSLYELVRTMSSKSHLDHGVIHGGNDEGDRFMQDGGWSSRRLVGLVGGLVARQWAQCTRRGALKARRDASCIDCGNLSGGM